MKCIYVYLSLLLFFACCFTSTRYASLPYSSAIFESRDNLTSLVIFDSKGSHPKMKDFGWTVGQCYIMLYFYFFAKSDMNLTKL
jgi:hypothetical protein